MGGSISSLFTVPDDESSEDYLQLTDLGAFLSKYIFIMLDKDKRKLVSKQEYLTLVNHFREQKTTEEELDNFLKCHVPEGQSTEYINEAGFRKLMIHLAMDFHRNIPDRMKYLMTLFDKDNDGYVSELDLCQVYDAIGIQVPMEPIRSLISKYDTDGDGRLSITEFEQLGRSAMNKLFIRKEELRSPEDALVEEALRKGSASLASGQVPTNDGMSDNKETTKQRLNPEDMTNNNDINKDVNNNDNAGFMVVDNVVFGKPVVLKDLETASSLFSDLNTASENGDPMLYGETSTNTVFGSDSGGFEEKSEKLADMDGVMSELQVEH